MLSLFIEDPGDPDWKDDDIEEIPSPPPPRRMATRAVPSASQSLAAGLDSDIEEIDSSPVLRPQPKVTLITPEDLVGLHTGDGQGIEACCQSDLSALREQVGRLDSGDTVISVC